MSRILVLDDDDAVRTTTERTLRSAGFPSQDGPERRRRHQRRARQRLVKLTFGRGTSLVPVPPIAPIGMGKDSRGVDLVSVDDIDERQIASWMEQAAAIPGFGKR